MKGLGGLNHMTYHRPNCYTNKTSLDLDLETQSQRADIRLWQHPYYL
jgi:hypothetical protein